MNNGAKGLAAHIMLVRNLLLDQF